MIAVCGAGSWGTALATSLARNTNDNIFIFGREPEVLQEITASHTNNNFLPGIKLPPNIVGCNSIAELLQHANDILIAVPSNSFLEVVRSFKPYLNAKHRIVWATKGIDPEDGRFLHEILEQEVGTKHPYAVLAGPSFAKEVARELPTAVTIATTDQQFGQDLLKYFHSENFRVYLSNDIIGTQVGGVLKNIFAVAAGMSDGLGFGANARAALITRGLAEMIRFGIALNAKPETLYGLAGMGDLVLTCTDDQSRNRRFGIALSQGKSIDAAQAEIGQIVEAVHNAAVIYKIAQQRKIEMPIATQVHKILIGEVTPREAVTNLISRKPAYE